VALVTNVSRTVSDQPLNYLQNFGGGNDEFLYEHFGPGKIRLKPGAAYCLRRSIRCFDWAITIL